MGARQLLGLDAHPAMCLSTACSMLLPWLVACWFAAALLHLHPANPTPQALLAHGLSPSVTLKGHDGRRRTLIKTWYNANWCAGADLLALAFQVLVLSMQGTASMRGRAPNTFIMHGAWCTMLAALLLCLPGFLLPLVACHRPFAVPCGRRALATRSRRAGW